MLSQPFRALTEKIRSHRAVVGVVGQGYVGFPLAQRIAQVGFPTRGFDVSGAVVDRCAQANRFPSYQALRSAIPLAECDVVIVAVPTPTTDLPDGRRAPDLGPVLAATRTILANLPEDGQGRLLVYESTYAPGTTRRRIAPLVAARHRLGETVALGYSPERIDPGNPTFHLVNTAKVTSGLDATAAALTQLFYGQLVERAVPASSLEAAEATKILENTFRFINITFAQEFDQYCERAGLSAREVTALAASKPFGFMPFYAGAGIGGHCIAEDPYYLYAAMQEEGQAAPLLAAALGNHEGRAAVLVERVVRRLGGRPIHGARLLVLGVSYKPNIGDARRSPAQPLLELLEAEGAVVEYHDPHVARFCGRRSIVLSRADPSDYDLAIVVTPHADVHYPDLGARGWRVMDLTNGSTRTDAVTPKRRPSAARLTLVVE